MRPGNAQYDGKFEVPTFDEVLELLAGVNASRRIAGKPLVGVYPETKHPTHFAKLGLSLEPALLAVARNADCRARRFSSSRLKRKTWSSCALTARIH